MSDKSTTKKTVPLKDRVAKAAYIAGKVIAGTALILVGLAIIVGMFLLFGWGLVAALAFITGGAIALSTLQGVVIILVLSFIAGILK